MLAAMLLSSSMKRLADEGLASFECGIAPYSIGNGGDKAIVFVERALAMWDADGTGVASEGDEAACIDGFCHRLER